MSAPLTIRLIRAFEGPRHDRLYAIWDAIAEYCSPELNIRWYCNDRGLRHAQCFDRIWEEEQEFDNEFVLLTEADFLPDLSVGAHHWTGVSSFTRPDQAAAGVCYCVRSEKNHKVFQRADNAAGWFISICKQRFPASISFEGSPDPGNQLRQQLRSFGKSISLLPGLDGFPHHYGMEYPYGTHLFWSRHYNDDPRLRISGFPLRPILRQVDWRITNWIAEQPLDFQELLRNRFGETVFGPEIEYVDLRSDFRLTFEAAK